MDQRPGDTNELGATRDLSSTGELLAGALRGEPGARGFLLDRLRPRLTLWVAARLSPKLREFVDAEDVVQEILFAVHEGLASFSDRGERPFFAWLFTIAENRIRDLADYAGARKRCGVPRPRVGQTTPATAAIRSEEIELLRAAIAGLSEDHRQVLKLRKLEERDTAEVAALMGRTEIAVRVLYCRALKELRRVMGATGSR